MSELSLDQTKNMCTPADVNQNKIDGTVNDCAFYNPSIGPGFCGNGTAAFCEIVGGTADDGFVIRFENDSSTDIHVNSYSGFNCLNAFEYGVDDHESMSYDLSMNREVRFFLTRADTDLTSINVKGVANDEKQAPDIINSLMSSKAIELFNDNAGGNVTRFFGSSAGGENAITSPKLDNVYIHNKGKGNIVKTDNDQQPTMSMITNSINFENLNTCAAQPYVVAAMVDRYSTAQNQTEASITSTADAQGVSSAAPTTVRNQQNIAKDTGFSSSTESNIRAPAPSVKSSLGTDFIFDALDSST